ncbi:inverse autotransporter beta domain-containing protein [Yersinia intermedia]|uniref:inverse autotransporter beta domain-containing protein n=2 Tax=Yersinia intermedia TaxID=631 RepID=UPI0005E8CFBF|nr:inverse autotransporter beta-barrel domain-containing protein [Yersinia intermedia]CNI17449.1 invasin [Yersinia intermedia]
MKKPIRLSIIATLLIGGGVLSCGLIPEMGYAESSPTRIYTVESRTSLYQIALQSGLDLRTLRKLNNGSLDKRDELNAGESLLLPANSPLFPLDPLAGKAIASNLPELGMGNDPVPLVSSGEQKTAAAAHAVGAQNWNNMTSDQMKNQAESWAKGQAKAQVVDPLRQQAQELLGKFGKAQVNLAVDDNGSLSKSAFSLFSPWYENDAMVAFSQVGVHRQDNRMIGNLGAGVRFDQGDWLFGANTFLDQDISRNHSRLGLGLEWWADNLKLASNYYHPLSGWKDSKDFDDYLERPARGFDVRAQGYLPVYQQLGASAVYEQYYGDEVALFGKDNLQKDPHAVTVGVDYTPFPLATLKVSHKMGKDGKNNTELGLQVSYQLGTPLEKQLDPGNVAAMRSLKGSRYDLVDRNYDIVLEYKEKAVLSLDLAAVPATLLEGDVYMMQPLVRSKYRITSVSWHGDAVPLLLVPTAGANNPQGWQITLPAWDATPGATNLYTLSISIVDEKGHQATSNDVEIRVGQQRLGRLFIDGDSAMPATGLDADAVKLSAHLEDHLGKSINDAALAPVWVARSLYSGAVVPLVTGPTCPTDEDGFPDACLRVVHTATEVRDGITYYVSSLISNQPGTFIITTDLGAYGVTNAKTITFTSASPMETVVARAEIRDPAGEDLLTTHNAPQVGVTYTVVLFDENDVDVTETLPADEVHWALDGTNTAGCAITLDNHDTGMTGYTFTPRPNASSNSGVVCGDQGFGLKVNY